jgi:hypothetical protein
VSTATDAGSVCRDGTMLRRLNRVRPRRVPLHFQVASGDDQHDGQPAITRLRACAIFS